MESSLEVQQHLEPLFKSKLDRNVSLLAADYCESEGLLEAAKLCQSSNEPVSKNLWSTFKFDWSHVQENPGGTSGRMNHFVQTKLEYTVAWAASQGEATAEVKATRAAALESLHLLWNQWAGYMVTTSEDYALALG